MGKKNWSITEKLRNDEFQKERMRILKEKSQDKKKAYQTKFEEEKDHYTGRLDNIILKVLEEAQKVEDDETLAKIFKKGEKEWMELCAKVRRTNKVIRLSPQMFRIRLDAVGRSVDEKEQPKKRAPRKKKSEEAKVVELGAVQEDKPSIQE